jgi:hypothetical protein
MGSVAPMVKYRLGERRRSEEDALSGMLSFVSFARSRRGRCSAPLRLDHTREYDATQK